MDAGPSRSEVQHQLIPWSIRTHPIKHLTMLPSMEAITTVLEWGNPEPSGNTTTITS